MSTTSMTPTSPQKIYGWGMTNYSISSVYCPETEEEIKKIMDQSIANKKKFLFRGAGCSYGDASINSDGIIVDMSKFNKIIEWDDKTSIIKVQSGATIQDLWQFAITRGYWPPIVSGTMFPTLGGALSMNIHGKNNFAVGPIGDHVIEFTFLTPSGEYLVCNRVQNRELFFAAIGGFGMLGCFLEISIKLKKIHSGRMKVYSINTNTLKEMFDYFEAEYNKSDYLVGWIDAFASGQNLGRGIIHKADYLKLGEEPNPQETFQLDYQHLPTTLLGVIPKSWMWIFLYPFTNNLGMRFVNYTKVIMGKFQTKPYLQSFAGFSFLLDYVPNWKFVYKPGSLIQYQSFVPEGTAHSCFKEILETSQKHGIIPYLAVFKRHKLDGFLMSYSVDGYSLALDFPVTSRNKVKLWQLAGILDKIVLKNGGKFYFAKDSTLTPQSMESSYTLKTIEKFLALKKKYDPDEILQSDLYKRLFL